MRSAADAVASAEFHAFFERHYAELARGGHLLSGGPAAAAVRAAEARLA
ncbi:SigE family RNA polymerase sigma factor, partial [Streptomyces tendae]